MDDLRSELRAVKAALRNQTSHQGKSGEPLQQYLLELSARENLLLASAGCETAANSFDSSSSSSLSLEALRSELHAVKTALRAESSHQGMLGEPLRKYLLELSARENVLLASGGQSMGAQPCEPAPSTPACFDRGSLIEVLAHLRTYEALPGECSKALRALVSLAYADATKVVATDGLLAQVLRIASLHGADNNVQENIGKVLKNLAFNGEVAQRSLSEPGVIAALLNALARFPSKQAGSTAGEALARIIAAETNPDHEAPPPSSLGSKPVALPIILAMFCQNRCAHFGMAKRFLDELVTNEVVHAAVVATTFVAVAATVDVEADADAKLAGGLGWLLLAEDFASDRERRAELPRVLLDSGVLGGVVSLMKSHLASREAQMAGVGTVVAYVDVNSAARTAIAATAGAGAVEAAMSSHAQDVAIQTLCVRFFKGCALWPKDVQTRAGFVVGRVVDLIKMAMAGHIDSAELQLGCLETLAFFIDHLHCHRLVKVGGGEGLIKVVMMRYVDAPKIQTWAKIVLDAMGADRFWAPKGLEEEDDEVSHVETPGWGPTTAVS